jgi:hypothetical protein
MTGRHQGSAADGGQLPRGRWKEQAMILIGLIVIAAAVLVMLTLRRNRRGP